MPIWKLQTWFGFDSAFARDRMIITPHFDDTGLGTDPQGLCNDLAAALDAWTPGTMEIGVRAYDAQGSQPVFPQGEKILNPGSTPATGTPREISLCLSYYSGANRPRYRGRLYIPGAAFGAVMGLRPSAGQPDEGPRAGADLRRPGRGRRRLGGVQPRAERGAQGQQLLRRRRVGHRPQPGA